MAECLPDLLEIEHRIADDESLGRVQIRKASAHAATSDFPNDLMVFVGFYDVPGLTVLAGEGGLCCHGFGCVDDPMSPREGLGGLIPNPFVFDDGSRGEKAPTAIDPRLGVESHQRQALGGRRVVVGLCRPHLAQEPAAKDPFTDFDAAHSGPAGDFVFPFTHIMIEHFQLRNLRRGAVDYFFPRIELAAQKSGWDGNSENDRLHRTLG